GEDPKEELSAWTEDLSGGARFDHPLSARLHELVERRGVPPYILLDVIRGMAMDLDRVRIASMAELREYCYLAAGAVGRACIPVFGGDLDRLAPYADALGEAFQLTNILRDVKEDAARDRIYLPADRMLDYGVSETDVLSGVLTEGFRELLLEIWTISEQDYMKAQALLVTSEDQKVMRPARAMEAYYHEIHREIRRRNFDVFS
ncbi:Squalene/phytoene synthase, partial [mine drainage metagenome]